jgi:hypothetical protein
VSTNHNPDFENGLLEDGLLEFDALTHRALDAESRLEPGLSPDELIAWRERLMDVEFAASIEQLEKAIRVLRNTPPIHAPPGLARGIASEIALRVALSDAKKTVPDGFASQVASSIGLAASLETNRVRVPQGFAKDLVAQIATSGQLLGLPRVHAPDGFAAQVASDIALENRLGSLALKRVPEGFAANLAMAISLEAELRQAPVILNSEPTEQAVRGLERVTVPSGFAARIASGIASEARAQPLVQTRASLPVPTHPEERNLTPFYFLAGTLGSAALALTALAWPYAQVAGATALEIGRTLPNGLIATILAVLALAGVASSGRVRLSLPVSLAAFALCAAVALPQIAPSFGAGRVAANETQGTVVRVGGDLSVAGHVTGDAISLGGNVRLEPGARVDGRIVTLLGDVNLPNKPAVAGGVSAVLGSTHVEGATSDPRPTMPNLSAASALKPLRALVSANYWQWFYLGIVCALVAVVGLLPGWLEALETPFWHESGRSIGLGLLALTLSVPLGLLAALTLIGAPLGLSLLSLAAVAFTLGLSVSAVQLGRVLRGAFRLPRNAMLEACLGLGVLALTLLWTPLGVAAWVLGGAWGAGALLQTWRSGRLAFVSQQLIEEFAG